MDHINNSILPIGTIITLTNNTRFKLMITGFYPEKDDGTKKDYIAVPYPMGCIDNKTFFAFNNDEIAEVLHLGYIDKSFEIYKHHYLGIEGQADIQP